ncbi:hypothetical protein BDV95DRAFT_609650 [Massariosphaeria phaeospora]|uniref:BTB domain-containing protein n=1 Tax=Massariosphaeria phaeospora TaxID=100035 RepID=A0A7C8MB77_9PLEO|nr:hypothetical protein BDV95DRAFT_609650 [Massariosphaeria phaeospora]
MAEMQRPKLQFPQCVQRNRNAPPPEAYAAPMVKVTVGKDTEKKSFFVYKGLLTYHSDYFRAALKNCWQEREDNSVDLPDEHPDVFHAFHYWLFSKRLNYASTPTEDELKKNGDIPLSYELLFKTYAFADRRGIAELANAALDNVFAKIFQMWVWLAFNIEQAYRDTPVDAALRRFLVDFGLHFFGFSKLNSRADTYPRDFLFDLITSAVEQRIIIGGVPLSREAYATREKHTFCNKYHVHKHSAEAPKKVS